MNIFDKIRKHGRREYMKYEDGKIIPVEVTEPKNYKEFNISPTEHEDLDIKNIIKEKVDVQGKVKKYGTWKTLKIVGAIAIVLFFGYTVKDVYIAFSEPSKTTQETPKDPTVGDATYTAKPVENQTPTSDTQGLYQTDNDGIALLPTVEEEKKQDKSNFKIAIDASNLAESQFYAETQKEIGSLNSYMDNKMNKSAFERHMKDSLEVKQQLLDYLSERKPLFEKEEILPYYQLIEGRLNNSIQLSYFILESFSSSESELIANINGFITKEMELKEEQNQAFIQLLKDNNIDYTVNEENSQIQYTIK